MSGEEPAEQSGSIPLGSSILESIAELIGEDAALRLSIQFGGRPLYIPHEPKPGSELVMAIGLEAARTLAKRHRGVPVMIPITAGKKARIVELRQAGRTVRDIARLVGCTERHVYQVVADYQESGGSLDEEAGNRPQMGLFDSED